MLVIEELPFPMWKAKTKSSLDAPYRWRHDKRGSTPQLANWKTAVRPKVQDETQKRLDAIPAAKPPGNDVYFAKLGKDATSEAKPQSTEFYIGTAKEIAEMLLVPTFDRSGTWAFYDVDHKVDWQISGRHAETVNEIGNLWLFNRKKNRDAGFPQAMRIRSCVDEFMDHADPYLTSKPSRKAVHSTYVTEFNKLIYSEAPDANDFEYWERPGIETGEYLKYLQPLTSGELTMVRGKPNEVQIFSRQGGGRVKSLAIDDQKKPIKKWEKKIRKSKKEVFEIQIVDFRKISDKGGTGNAGQVTGDVFRGSDVLTESDFVVGLEGIPGLPYAAYLSKSAIKLQMQAQGLSPVVVPDLEFDPFDGFIGRGKILPSAELLKSVDVNLVLDSTGIGVEALLAADSLALPGPFEVTGGSLALFAGTGGIGITGRLNFEIKKLAKGHVQAAAGNKNGAPKFELEGALDFDTKLFDQAHLDLWYRDEHWGVTGELGIEQPGKIKGIKRASAKVEVKDETVSATGEFEPSIKGIQKGSLAFTYDKTTGMEITGEILLGQGIPGIKSGKLAATIKEGPEKHSLSGDLSLEPSVPGVTGEVKGRYDDGMFLVDAQLGYEKGFAKGSVHLGVTNQPIGADGKPGGAPTPDGGVGVFGDGTVTLQLTPWLTGTVGLKLTPDGQVEVSGEVALPPVFTVFDETAITKELLSVHVDIPIIGVAVAGQRIGIFASIGGSVRVDAGVGPGQLRDMALKVTYNPAKPEATTVTGSAKFAVPAHAALRLSVDGSVGVGIPVVSAKAGLTVFGEIGVAGEASAGTAVTWTPTAGVVLDARGEISVEPKFKFGIDAFVDVSADLWLTTIEIYHETWKLKEFEYGSNLRFGLALPVHYESGKPFEISFDQIQWTYPKIEPKELISGLVKQVVGE